MKILHVGKYYPPFSGGIENFMGHLLPLLVKKGNKITALVHHHLAAHASQEEVIEQVRVIRVASYGRLLYAPISPAFPFYLQGCLKQFKPDVLHIHLPNTSAFWLLLLPAAKKIPWVIHWHSDVIGSAPNKLVTFAYYLYQPLEQLLLKASQKIIVTSPHYQHSSTVLKPWFDKTQVIPLGLGKQNITYSDEDKYYAEQLWNNSKHHLLSIGRLTYYKGHQYLIKAMQNLPESRLLIVGEGEEYTSLQALIQQLNLEKQVILTGKLSNQKLHALLASCDIFCLPSIERTEAFGLVLLEAMSYAKPTMVSSIEGSGMTWVCQNEKTGVHTIACDSEDIALKLQTLCNKSDYCTVLGDNGKQRLERVFDLDDIADKTLNLYDNLEYPSSTSETT